MRQQQKKYPGGQSESGCGSDLPTIKAASSVAKLVGESKQQQKKHPIGGSDSGRGSSLPTTNTTTSEHHEVVIHDL